MKQTRLLKRAACHLAILASLTLTTGMTAHAQTNNSSNTPNGGEMMIDLLLVRPISLIGSVLGTAGFIVSLPFTVPTQSAGDAAQTLVSDPFTYTFNRPLGDFDNCGADRQPCTGRR